VVSTLLVDSMMILAVLSSSPSSAPPWAPGLKLEDTIFSFSPLARKI
jgi:hypothetical protein